MAYYDCAQRTASVPKRKAITLPKNNKRKTGLSGSNSSIEIIYHDQLPNTGGYETSGANNYIMNYQVIRQSNEIITYKLATTCTIASDPMTSHGQIDLAYNE